MALRSCLVQYRGGGYDGCFWEWNYAFLDPHGEFHNLLSTGSKGAETFDDLLEHLCPEKFSDYRSPYLYQMDQPADREEFIRETNAGGVLMVANWLAKHWPELALIGPCSECQIEFPLQHACHDGYRGGGGISIVMCGHVCPDCAARMRDANEEVYDPQVPTEPVHATQVSGEAIP